MTAANPRFFHSPTLSRHLNSALNTTVVFEWFMGRYLIEVTIGKAAVPVRTMRYEEEQVSYDQSLRSIRQGRACRPRTFTRPIAFTIRDDNPSFQFDRVYGFTRARHRRALKRQMQGVPPQQPRALTCPVLPAAYRAEVYDDRRDDRAPLTLILGGSPGYRDCTHAEERLKAEGLHVIIDRREGLLQRPGQPVLSLDEALTRIRAWY